MKAYPISMEIAGNTAMWTRPDTGTCPVSYPAPTYSAVRNIFQSVLWGEAIKIIPTQVDICNPLKFHTYYTNYGGPLRKSDSIKKGNNYQLLATVLTDVRYRLYADVIGLAPSENESEATKHWRKKTSSPGHAYQEIFERRLKRGQCFHMIFLGWKEFTASYFGPIITKTEPADISVVLPSMFYDIKYTAGSAEPKFIYDQNVVIEHGTICYNRKKAGEL